MKPTKCPAREKKWGKKSEKRREERKRKVKVKTAVSGAQEPRRYKKSEQYSDELWLNWKDTFKCSLPDFVYSKDSCLVHGQETQRMYQLYCGEMLGI